MRSWVSMAPEDFDVFLARPELAGYAAAAEGRSIERARIRIEGAHTLHVEIIWAARLEGEMVLELRVQLELPNDT